MWETQLFVSFIRPREAISRQTLSRYGFELLYPLLEFMLNHSNHTALGLVTLTSKVKAACISLDVNLRPVGWSTSRSLDRFNDNLSSQQHLRRQYYKLSKLWQSPLTVSLREELVRRGDEISF